MSSLLQGVFEEIECKLIITFSYNWLTILDVINKDTFEYIGADAHLTGGVSWAMVFRWDWLTNEEFRTMDHTVGLKTPTIAGGLFSICKFKPANVILWNQF